MKWTSVGTQYFLPLALWFFHRMWDLANVLAWETLKDLENFVKSLGLFKITLFVLKSSLWSLTNLVYWQKFVGLEAHFLNGSYTSLKNLRKSKAGFCRPNTSRGHYNIVHYKLKKPLLFGNNPEKNKAHRSFDEYFTEKHVDSKIILLNRLWGFYHCNHKILFFKTSFASWNQNANVTTQVVLDTKKWCKE